MVVPSEDLTQLELAEGFNNSATQILSCIDKHGGFMFRYLVEYNTDFRQPIPYILVRHNDKVFATRRLQGSGESRLHGKISLGIGGHINPEDYHPESEVVENALYREVEEELIMDELLEYNTFLEGFINDNSNEVSRDHLAVVYSVKVDRDNVSVKETDKLEGRFYTIEELKENYDNLESWSQLILDQLLQKK